METVQPYKIELDYPLDQFRNLLTDIDPSYSWGEYQGSKTVTLSGIRYFVHYVGLPSDPNRKVVSLIAKEPTQAPHGQPRIEQLLTARGIQHYVSTIFTLTDTFDPFDL